MLRIIASHKRWITLLFALILIIFFLLPELKKRHSLFFIERPVLILTTQIQRGISYIFNGIDNTLGRVKKMSTIQLENKMLLKEVERLKGENRRLQEMGLLNKQLREMLGYKKSLPFKTLAARVTGRDPTNWYKTIIIDRGESDGIAKDMGVIVPAGIIGRVIKVGPDFSQVLLITDINSSTSILIERTRNEGIVEGRGSSPARVKYIPVLSGIKVGDLVLTSGLAGGFPKGLVVGRVKMVEDRPSELFQDVEMLPAVDLNRLEEVLVITSLN